ncbi:N-6 DNA methylase [Streptomyces sp. HB2AG]|uniref:N-6 DNA methylase n=1 Tax=Streptomyces sp. HB2AG TaxID=2983400 RepID=UPI0022AAE386|nr:N-6 DNA methylase [Streptomyces sp. HB2AG]MCZ2525382.1 N-6 DNA methylase [Streptomyces sp. HB2AG]
MPQPSAQVTAAEISRIAGVTRATVSNWRRRHEDFPAPSGGTETSPLYDLEAVRAWLRARGQSSAATPAEELRTLLRLHGPGTGMGAGLAPRLLPLVLAASRRSPEELAALAALSDTDLTERAAGAAAELPDAVPDVPGAEAVRFLPQEAAAVRALLRCVREQNAQAALDVLAERELEDSSSTGTYPTPDGLADLMARLLPPGAARVLDPACGSGSLLAAAARHGAKALYGQDALPVQARRSAVRLLLAAPDAEVAVRSGDSLRADAFADATVDAVLCNPPYGDRDWGHDELAYDPRWAYGVPARSEPELAWAQHSLAHLEPGGHAVLLLPPATAARTSGRRVRAELVRSGALRAVVGLPAGAAAPLHIGLHLWVLQRPEPGGPERSSVLFVDADGERRDSTRDTARTGPPRPRRRGALDWDELSAGVLAHWTAFRADPDSVAEEPGAARVVPVIDLLDELVDLTPARQARALPSEIDPAAVAERAEERRRKLAERAGSLVEAAGLGPWRPAGESARQWRTATVSDLARGGALENLRAAPPARSGRSETRRPASDPSRAPRPAGPGDGRPVLTGADIARGERASATQEDMPVDSPPPITEGDVLVRAIALGSGPMARVADEQDAEALLGHNVFLLRPDPARLDPWFLAGFLQADDNIAGASTGSTSVHLQPGRLRVPLLPLEEQRRYGEAFRRVHALRAAARRAADLAAETADLLAGGLTSGALLPPDTDTP